jgi:hypothetical protein
MSVFIITLIVVEDTLTTVAAGGVSASVDVALYTTHAVFIALLFIACTSYWYVVLGLRLVVSSQYVLDDVSELPVVIFFAVYCVPAELPFAVQFTFTDHVDTCIEPNAGRFASVDVAVIMSNPLGMLPRLYARTRA